MLLLITSPSLPYRKLAGAACYTRHLLHDLGIVPGATMFPDAMPDRIKTASAIGAHLPANLALAGISSNLIDISLDRLRAIVAMPE